MKKVLLVIPTYNEVDNIAPLVDSIQGVFRKLENYSVNILFVDDNSPDQTARAILKAQSRNNGIYLLKSRREGLGRAYIKGFEHGHLISNYDIYLTMDADMSHDPRDIPDLLRELEKGYDVVLGSRYIAGGKTDQNYSFIRKLESALANLIAGQCLVAHVRLKDLTSGFRAINAGALRTLPLHNISASGYVFQVSLLNEFLKQGYKVSEVPINFHARQYGRSKLRFKDILEFLYQAYSFSPKSNARRMMRFISVGASGTIVNIAVLFWFVQILHFDVILAYLIALETSIISNFCFNHWFTFRVDLDKHGEQNTNFYALITKFWRYNLVSLGGAAISWIIFTTLYKELGLNYIAADLLGIATALTWNYAMSTRIVWKIVDSEVISQTELQKPANAREFVGTPEQF